MSGQHCVCRPQLPPIHMLTITLTVTRQCRYTITKRHTARVVNLFYCAVCLLFHRTVLFCPCAVQFVSLCRVTVHLCRVVILTCRLTNVASWDFAHLSSCRVTNVSFCHWHRVMSTLFHCAVFPLVHCVVSSLSHRVILPLFNCVMSSVNAV